MGLRGTKCRQSIRNAWKNTGYLTADGADGADGSGWEVKGRIRNPPEIRNKLLAAKGLKAENRGQEGPGGIEQEGAGNWPRKNA